MEKAPSASRRRHRTIGGQQPGRHYFVGRRAVLETLYNAMIESVQTRTLRVVCICGAAGIGKSRLVSELLQILKGSGRPLRCYDVGLGEKAGHSLLSTVVRRRFELDEALEGGPPSQRDRLDRLALGLSDLVSPRALDDALRLLASVAGIMTDAEGRPLPGFDPELMRSAPFRERADKTALNLLRYDAAIRPLVLAVDDWDRAAVGRDLDMARTLLASLVDRAALALVLSREPVHESLALPAPARVIPLELTPLDGRDIERLVRGLLERVEELPDEIVQSAVSQAAGVPLMGVELVRLLVHRGVVRTVPKEGKPNEYRWVARPESFQADDMPADVDSAAQQCFRGLPDHEREIVSAAATFGSTFWVRGVVSLSRAHTDAEPAALGGDRVRMKTEGSLMSLTDAGVFDMADDGVLNGQPLMQFANPALRDYAYERLDEEQRARLHRLAAQWIACAIPADRLAWLEAIAGHLEAGGLGREAAERYLEAGEEATRANNPVGAVELFRRGLGLVGDDAALVGSRLLDRLGRAHLSVSEYEEAEVCLNELLRLATLLDDELRVAGAHTLTSDVLRERGEYDRAEEHLEFALSLFGQKQNTAGMADAKERLAWLMWQRGDKDAFHTAAEYLEETLRHRRRLRDPIATARTMTTLGDVKFSMGELERSITLHREALSIREQLDDRRGQVLTLNGLGAVRYHNGEVDEAMRLWKRAATLASELGDRAQHALAQIHLGDAQLEQGELDRAEPALNQALADAEELGLAWVRGLALGLLSLLQLARKQDSRALELAEEALELGYSVESKQVVSRALLAKARALSHALFVADPSENDDRQREASGCFQQAITLLEEMGEIPTLVRVLDAYGTFLSERGIAKKGRKVLERADKLRVHMRCGKQKEDFIHEARTIRRSYPSKPIQGREVQLVLDGMKKRRKRKPTVV